MGNDKPFGGCLKCMYIWNMRSDGTLISIDRVSAGIHLQSVLHLKPTN